MNIKTDMNTKNDERGEFPDEWWNTDIHPILGYVWKRLPIKPVPYRSKLEYNPEDDIKL